MQFKEQHTIRIMGSTYLKGKAPPDCNWKAFHRSFAERTVTPHQMAAAIWQGYAFTPVYKNGRRREENFVAAWHMAFDFDSDGASLDYLMREGSIAWLFSSFAYSTPSSTADHPKSRVVFVLDEPVTSPERARELYRALAWQFEQDGSKTDPQCKDPLRLYYGSPECELRGNWSMLKNSSDDERPSMVDWFITEYDKAHPPAPKPMPDPTVSKIPPSENLIETIVGKLLDHIVQAPDGEKHGTLNRISFTLGGYVASGYLSESEAISKAEAAIIQNGRAKDLQAARRTIETAVRDGQSQPITIDREYKNDLDSIL